MVRLNHFYRTPSGYRAVMRSSEVQGFCLDRARDIGAAATAAGGGPYRYDVVPGQNRAHARASTDGWPSYFRERKHGALAGGLKSMGRDGQMTERARQKWRDKAHGFLGYPY